MAYKVKYRHYDTSYGVASLLFVANALGFIIAALFIGGTTDRLGYAKTFALCQLIIAVGHAPLSWAAPFPVLIPSFFLMGSGGSFALTLSNVFCGSLRSTGISSLAAVNGAYGVGATVGPLLSSLAARTVWSRYYLLTLGLTIVSGVFVTYAFLRHEEGVKSAERPSAAGDGDQARKTKPEHVDLHGMFSAVSTRTVLLGAVFGFIYRAMEVSISSGEFSSREDTTTAFWAGITAGRLLLWAAQHVDEQRLVYGSLVSAITVESMVWVAPGIVSSWTAAGAIGLLLGPVYPCAAAVFVRSMSKHEQVSGIGVISAFASSGGAAAPFTMGMVGPAISHPVAIGLFGVMVCFWSGLPRRAKRTE